MRLGFGVGANDVELVLRSLPSLPLRYEAQARAGLRARALVGAAGPRSRRCCIRRSKARRGTSTGRACAATRPGCSRSSSTRAIRASAVDAFVDALKLFRIGYSWAGPVSLAVPYDLAAMRAEPRWPGTLVRFSVGLEAVEDLIDDCEQALAALPATERRGPPRRRQRRRRRRIVSGSGAIVNDELLARLAAARRGDARRSRSGRAAIASAILISSIARWRPGQTRGPAPNGIDDPVRRRGAVRRVGARASARARKRAASAK